MIHEWDRIVINASGLKLVTVVSIFDEPGAGLFVSIFITFTPPLLTGLSSFQPLKSQGEFTSDRFILISFFRLNIAAVGWWVGGFACVLCVGVCEICLHVIFMLLFPGHAGAFPEWC